MNISLQELIIILVGIVLFIKPKDLPKIAYEIGRMYQKCRLMYIQFTDELQHIYEINIPKPTPQKERIPQESSIKTKKYPQKDNNIV